MLQILVFPHPTLRHQTKPVRHVDTELRKNVRQMFDLMYEARGVGLAGNQVDLPLRLFVANLACDPEEGEEYVFINPVISRAKGMDEQDEGCLSLPEMYGAVKRPETVHIQAFDLNGKEVNAELSGLFARVAQHETDHLDGILFTDRLSETGKMDAEEMLQGFQLEFEAKRKDGTIPSDDQIAARLSKLEGKYC